MPARIVPTALKILNGNPGHRDLNEYEPQPRPADACEPPDRLDEYGREIWSRIVPELQTLRLLTVVDLDQIANYCQAYSEVCRATKTLNEEGRYLSSRNGVQVAHPAGLKLNQAMTLMARYSAMFGLDPSSRTKIKTPPVSNQDEFEQLLNEQVG